MCSMSTAYVGMMYKKVSYLVPISYCVTLPQLVDIAWLAATILLSRLCTGHTVTCQAVITQLWWVIRGRNLA